ncbi:phosphatase PAP2 family protein [Mucilaginibacter sp. SJ]|uniref:phosphatase PAP2 family protein n=1 Tax=Mucilaginibacter sp. SJ TaxID=3029053 RepID=UPI0023A94979|nr:phosphatase PAP2 family protein [Mucilaginibacter sp. SJ]WEA01800.1 phosphatase PAP2 family protein [Mucilaginibacter sp. SJ]
MIAYTPPASAQVRDSSRRVNIADTIRKDLFTAPDTVSRLRSKAWTLLPPAIFVAYGASSFYIHPLRRFDNFINDNAQEHNFVPKPVTENYLQYAPVIITYGVNLVGVHGKNTFVDRTLIYVLAQGMLNLSVFGLKNATHRLRPNGANNYSFPSGHTANAFAGAEFMAQELGDQSWLYSFAGYAFATTTGIFRIYHTDHWFSDVVAGAGFGILATKGAYLLYPVIRNSLSKKHRKSSPVAGEKPEQERSGFMLMPSYSNGVAGIQFAMVF